MRPLVRALVALPLLALVAAVGYWAAVVRPKVPSNDRHWSPPHARMPRTTFRGDTVIIEDFRRFRYAGPDRYREAWGTDTVYLSRLRSVRYALSPFGAEWTGSAHSFVTFAFADSQVIAVSAEGRREVGETFGFRQGVTRGMELIYVVGDERDVVRRRVVDGDDVYLYPVNSPPHRSRQMLVALLQSANRLRERPEFYSLVDHNCTSVLIDHVNAIIPGRVPTGWRTLLPGYADRVAQEIGLISDSTITIAELRRRYHVNPIARGLADDARFSARLHAALGDTLR